MTKLVNAQGTCQVIDLAEFKAARARQRVETPPDVDVAEQLPLLADPWVPGSRAGLPLVQQVTHRQRMLAHLEALSARATTQSV